LRCFPREGPLKTAENQGEKRILYGPNFFLLQENTDQGRALKISFQTILCPQTSISVTLGPDPRAHGFSGQARE
jgi:hypothetical protein